MRKEYGGMGSRHLYGFNLTMLRKQGWRLKTNHDTIIAKVFKVRYFLKGNFVDVKLGHNPNYVWCSIHASQVMVRGDLKWRLGDSSQIRAWYNPWINDERRDCATSNVPTEKEGMTINKLIEDDNNEWKMDVVKEAFNERDTENIQPIPIMDKQGRRQTMLEIHKPWGIHG